MTITFTHNVDDVLTDVTSVKVATGGVTRTDTGAIVLAADTPLTKSSTGIYTVDVTEPASGLTYAYALEWVYDGETYSEPFTAEGTSTTLCSLADAKTYMGISGTTYDTKLTALLTAASDAIENYCDRVFASASYVDYFDGRDNWRNGYLRLKQCPVTAISRMASEPTEVLTVKNESAAVQLATIAVTSTGVTLSSTASGVTTTAALTFAAYPTIGALADAMTARGFTATVANTYSLWPSALIRQPQGALNCKSGGLTNGATLYLYTRELSVARIDYDEGTIYGFIPFGRRTRFFTLLNAFA